MQLLAPGYIFQRVDFDLHFEIDLIFFLKMNLPVHICLMILSFNKTWIVSSIRSGIGSMMQAKRKVISRVVSCISMYGFHCASIHYVALSRSLGITMMNAWTTFTGSYIQYLKLDLVDS